MHYAITTDAEFSAALDYLPVAARAYDRNRESDMLWLESIAVHRAVLDYADAALTGHVAAGVQAGVNSILGTAVLRDDLAVAPGAYDRLSSMAVRSERTKRRIRGLIAAR